MDEISGVGAVRRYAHRVALTILPTIGVIVLVVSAAAQSPPKGVGVFSRVPRGKAWKAPQRFGPHGVDALVFLDPERLVVSVQGPPRRPVLWGTTLSFYSRKGGILFETHRFTTEFLLVQMYPTVEGDRLITTWTTGSTYWTGIFAWEDKGEPRSVLWESWKGEAPEFLEDGDRIVFAVGGAHDEPPETAAIYRWTGKGYEQLPLVPWVQRYQPK